MQGCKLLRSSPQQELRIWVHLEILCNRYGKPQIISVLNIKTFVNFLKQLQTNWIHISLHLQQLNSTDINFPNYRDYPGVPYWCQEAQAIQGKKCGKCNTALTSLNTWSSRPRVLRSKCPKWSLWMDKFVSFFYSPLDVLQFHMLSIPNV